jgi:beta-lactam-binding protein with PASTA domain
VRGLLKLALLALVLCAVALASALTAMRYAIHGREVEVPDLVGLLPAQAEDAAAERGLQLVLDGRFYSPEVEEGKVMSQLPRAGVKVRRGGRVRVAESLGPQRVEVPGVVGQSARAAEINLRRRGLELGRVATAHLPGLAPGQVAAQSPGPGAEQVHSPRVDLLIAVPPPAVAYVMPDLVGHPLAEAARRVQEAGLRVASVQRVSDSTLSGVSIVLRQSPAPGERVTPGMAVSFEVSR